MRRQVPNNIDVVLEQAKVYAYGIEVVKLSQFASIDYFLHPTYGSGVNKGVVDHQNKVFCLC